MKSFKLWLAALFVGAIAMPLINGSVASAQGQPVLECTFSGAFPEGMCDMAILKEVSVNGGSFVDANTSLEAAQAAVGNTVTWRITVTNESTGDYLNPIFTVYIEDVLPAGFNLGSAVASDGSFSSNIWTLPLITEVGEGSFSNLPSVLTLTTTATTVGLFENIANFSEYDECGDDCIVDYWDTNPENDQNSAFVNVSAPPVVLGESTPVVLAATGSGTTESLVAAGLIGATLLTLGYSRFARKQN